VELSQQETENLVPPLTWFVEK